MKSALEKGSTLTNSEKEFIRNQYLVIRQHKDKYKERRKDKIVPDSIDEYLKDNIRMFRLSLKRVLQNSDIQIDPRIILYYSDSTPDTTKQIFFLRANSHDEVVKFIRDSGLPSDVPSSLSELLGGLPVIKRVCDGRYSLKYNYNF